MDADLAAARANKGLGCLNLLKTDEREWFNYLMPWLTAVWKLLKELNRVKIGCSCFGKRPRKTNWDRHGELCMFGPWGGWEENLWRRTKALLQWDLQFWSEDVRFREGQNTRSPAKLSSRISGYETGHFHPQTWGSRCKRVLLAIKAFNERTAVDGTGFSSINWDTGGGLETRCSSALPTSWFLWRVWLNHLASRLVAESEVALWPFHLLRSCVLSTEELNAASSGATCSEDELQIKSAVWLPYVGKQQDWRKKNG